MGKFEFLTSYALKSAILYKSKRDFDHELHFLLYIFNHLAKYFDQTCMPTGDIQPGIWQLFSAPYDDFADN